jgi:hypothetical protein
VGTSTTPRINAGGIPPLVRKMIPPMVRNEIPIQRTTFARRSRDLLSPRVRSIRRNSNRDGCRRSCRPPIVEQVFRGVSAEAHEDEGFASDA